MQHRNCYQDDEYAGAYAELEFPATYYLAFRDLPALIRRYVTGRRALDIGCGAGRSTRFLKQLGFDTIGADIAAEMVEHARAADAGGDYRVVTDGDLAQFADGSFDLILSAFTFDNVAPQEHKLSLLTQLRRMLTADGRIVNLVSSPEIYLREWASFTTKDFPENRHARCGDPVRIIVTALKDRRPAVDVLFPDDAYRVLYAQAGLRVLDVHRPLGRADEPYDWVSETKTSPWTIYVLGRRIG